MSQVAYEIPVLRDPWAQQNAELQMWKDYVLRLSTAYCHDKHVLAHVQHQWEQACAAQTHLKAELENEQLAHRRTKEQLDEERLDHGTALEDLSWQRHRLHECEEDTNAACDALQRCRQIADASLSALASVKGRAPMRCERNHGGESDERLRGMIIEENSSLQLRNKELERLLESKDNEVAAMERQMNDFKHKKSSNATRGRRGGRNRSGKKKQRT